MSASPPAARAGSPPAGSAADPSMEDILASIRRILSEDEAAAGSDSGSGCPAASRGRRRAGARRLDAGRAQPPRARRRRRGTCRGGRCAEPAAGDDAVDQAAAIGAGRRSRPPPRRPGPAWWRPRRSPRPPTSLGTLVRTLAEHQSIAVHRGGPTLEDIVREEMRPMLKAWLDKNLPPLVERLVARRNRTGHRPRRFLTALPTS